VTAQELQSPDTEVTREIIVTGERVARKEADTASSVVVISANDVERASADRLDQLLALVPNIQLGSGEEGPAIRGQDSTGQLRNLYAFLGGTRPRATLTVDGRSVGYYEFVFGSQSTWDLDQVEIFRSPQTTTQGRNSIAGAIFVTTARPSSDWEGRAQIIAGNFEARQLSAALSGPLVKDELLMRVSGTGHLGRVSSEMADAIPAADIDRDDYGTGRIKLLYEPRYLPGATFETTFAYTRSQSPQFEGTSPPFKHRKVPVPALTIGVWKVEATSVTGRAEYEVKDGLRSTVTMSLGDALLQRFGLPGLGRTRVDSSDFSLEPVLVLENGNRLSLLVGANRNSTNQHQTIDLTNYFGFGMGSFDDNQDSFGVFGETTFRPSPRLSITGGLRYQWDRQMRVGGVSTIVLDYDKSFDAWLPKLSMSYNISQNVTVGALIQRAYNPGGISISLSRRESDTFAAESLWNYEGFFRAKSADGRASFSANAFYNDIKDAQRPQFVAIALPDGDVFYDTEFANAPAARTYGLEASFGWRATDKLDLNVGLGLLDTKVVRTLEQDDQTLGKSFQRSPAFSASGAIDWKPIEELRLSVQIRHQSGYFSDDKNDLARRIGASTVVDGRASYTMGQFTIFAYARNLFDSFYMTYIFNPALGTAGKPRELGAGIEAQF